MNNKSENRYRIEEKGIFQQIMGGRVLRNNYKGHMDKTKEGWKQGREAGLAGMGVVVGGKCRQK